MAALDVAVPGIFLPIYVKPLTQEVGDVSVTLLVCSSQRTAAHFTAFMQQTSEACSLNHFISQVTLLL